MILSQRLHRVSSLLALAALALLLPGCVPVAWLPDSSGFVYVNPVQGKNPGDKGSGQLVHFDLKKNSGRVLVNDIGDDTAWPAVSPDGKRIAVARYMGDPKQAKTVQVIVYDFDGKQVQQSKPMAWPQPADNKSISLQIPLLLFWSPKDDMVVVSDFNHLGLFNVRTETVKVIEQAIPVIHNGTPIRPDGRGVLVLLPNKVDPKKPSLVFLEWDGTRQEINSQALAVFEKKDDKAKSAVDAVTTTVLLPLLLPSWWEGNSAYAGFKRDKVTYHIDTAQKTTVVSEDLAKFAKAEKKDEKLSIRYDFAGDVSVHLVPTGDPAPKPGMSSVRVVAVNHQTKKEKELLPKVESTNYAGLLSPDGKHLALCYGEFSTMPGRSSTIAVIGSKGELVTKIETGK
jgi:hypothetical protein